MKPSLYQCRGALLEMGTSTEVPAKPCFSRNTCPCCRPHEVITVGRTSCRHSSGALYKSDTRFECICELIPDED